MSEKSQLSAAIRSGSVTNIKDVIPAVIYGSGIENASLALNRPEFEKVFAQAGESGLIALKLDDGRELPVIIKDLQFDPVRERVIHVDFFKVNMDEKVSAETSLNFIGEAPVVKAHGGVVVEHLDQLHIECLPTDLIQKIDIDLSILVNIGDTIHVSDIVVPKGVTIKNDPTEIIVNVVEPKVHVEEPINVPEGTAAEGAAPADAKDGDKKEAEAGDKKEDKK